MNKKINKQVLEQVQLLCYEAILGEQIDAESMKVVKTTAENYLNNNGYKIRAVKCDYENNQPSTIDINRIIIDIIEEVHPGSSEYLKHRIIL